MAHHHQRKAERDDPLLNALSNLLEDLASAQDHLDQGKGQKAKAAVDEAIQRFRLVAYAGIRDLIVSVELGRIRLTLDYIDGLGEIQTTYTARRSL